MTRQSHWLSFARLLVLPLIGVASHTALADQHCVVCEVPAATYLCEAQNGPGILAANGGQLACITELAKRGGHDSCAIMRKGSAQCDGLVPTVLYPGTSDADLAAGNEAPTNLPPADAPTAATTPQPAVPGTPPPPATDGVANSATDTYTPVDAGTPYGADAPTDDRIDATSKDAKANAPQRPPKTVVEMADRAYVNSKKGLDKAGKAVGDTAKSAGNVVTDTAKKTGKAVGNAASKTWNCLTSLFSDC